jgi:hypothetical protein
LRGFNEPSKKGVITLISQIYVKFADRDEFEIPFVGNSLAQIALEKCGMVIRAEGKFHS